MTREVKETQQEVLVDGTGVPGKGREDSFLGQGTR